MTRAAFVLMAALASAGYQPAQSGNPIFPGWYADPEAHVFQNEYWIYPTYSAPYDQQIFMDAFSSRDLVTWTKHPRILDAVDVKWAKRAMWAPSVIEKDGWYYLFFGANDIQNDNQIGGIGVARARQPGGPFKDYLGTPLIDKFHNGAQPIDQFVFKDTDGAHYIVYGGWRHCNIARLNDNFTGLVPFADGSTFKEITPQGYVEGAFMLQKDGKYYFMWSEGGWTGPNYAVAYAVGSSPFGPFERIGKILQQDRAVATGAGHHSVLHADGSDKWYIVYHRRPLGNTDRNHRVVSIDELRFDDKGLILPVKITASGVAREPLRTPQANPPRTPTSVLGATLAPQRVPTPGPATDQPYAPQAILPGGTVIPIYQAGSPLLKADRIREPEVYNMTGSVPGRIASLVNIHNPSIELHRVPAGMNTGRR